MSGHGHVVPNPDGSKARCGGPAICSTCAIELAAQYRHPAKVKLGKKSATDPLTILQSLADCGVIFGVRTIDTREFWAELHIDGGATWRTYHASLADAADWLHVKVVRLAPESDYARRFGP